MLLLFQILQAVNEKVIFAKYEGELKQKEENAIEKEIKFPILLIAMEQYAFTKRRRDDMDKY